MKINIKINTAKLLASTLLVSGSIGVATDLSKDFSSSTVSSIASVLAPMEVQASAVSLALPPINAATQSNSATYQQPAESYNNVFANYDNSAITFAILPGDNSYQQPATSYNSGYGDSTETFGMIFGNNSGSSTYQQPTMGYNNDVDSAMTFGTLPGDNIYQQPTASYDDSTETFGMIFGNNSGSSTYQQPTMGYNNDVDSAMTFGTLPGDNIYQQPTASYDDSTATFGMIFGNNSGSSTYQQPATGNNNGVVNYDDYTMMITGNSNNNNSYTPAISGISFKIGETSSIIDVAPYIENGNTMIPVRAMANLLGVSDNNIIYDNKTQRVTITYYGRVISLTIGDDKLYITENGNTGVKTMDNGAKAVTKEGRTFVPVRAISEAFGLQVIWDNDTQTVTLKSY